MGSSFPPSSEPRPYGSGSECRSRTVAAQPILSSRQGHPAEVAAAERLPDCQALSAAWEPPLERPAVHSLLAARGAAAATARSAASPLRAAVLACHAVAAPSWHEYPAC